MTPDSSIALVLVGHVGFAEDHTRFGSSLSHGGSGYACAVGAGAGDPGRVGVVAHVGEDFDQLLTSPRDGQKYVVRYGLAIDRAGHAQPIAWEHTGSGGNRFVALSMGYVEAYNEQGFKQLKR